MSLLGIVNWSGFSLLTIDPGLTCTGWAVYKLGNTSRLVDMGRVRSQDFVDGDEILPKRLSPILDSMRGVCNLHRCAVVAIEQPPQTIYNSRMLKKEMVIAKAQSVFKTFAVCAALFADLRLAASVQLATTVLPVQWEFSKKQRGGMDVKEWSLQFANSVIVNSGSGGLEQLHTKEDQNVADAVSMGHIISEKQK